MERFKLNDKEYFIEVQDNNECIITEFGNKNNQYVMSIEELRDLKIKFNKTYAFCESRITSNIVTDIKIASITEKAVFFDVALSGQYHNALFQVSIGDFCKDLLITFLSDETNKHISEKMPSFKTAFDSWKYNSCVPFMNKTYAVYDLQQEIIGIGCFEGEKAIIISKNNLSMFDEVIIAMPHYSCIVKLSLDEKKTSYEYVYKIKVVGKTKYIMLNNAVLEGIKAFDLKNEQDHERLIDHFKIRTFGKTKSDLDNFFDI